MRRAILSVSDKTGLVEFGRVLQARGFMIISTGNTHKALVAGGVEAMKIESFTGVPEVMDGRVKTIHPKIAGGILAQRQNPEHMHQLTEVIHSATIDLVVVNLYPFKQAADNPATTVEKLIEEIDIGGPSLVRAAAKNFKHVLVVVDPGDYVEVLGHLDSRGDWPMGFRLEMMRKAFGHTAKYDAVISQEMDYLACFDGEQVVRLSKEVLPKRLILDAAIAQQLRYGENSHQKAAFYMFGGKLPFKQLQGKELSYTNLLDVDAAVRVVTGEKEPCAVVVKHTNPCGAAIVDTLAEAYVKARDADPISAYGGIVGLNRELDVETASEIAKTFIEVVVCPSIDKEAESILAKKQNMRVLICDPSFVKSFEVRSCLGGFLGQEPDPISETTERWTPDSLDRIGLKVVTKRVPNQYELDAMRFGMRICARVKSNAVIFTTSNQTSAIGAGQTSRVDSVKIAVIKSEQTTEVPAGQPPLTGSIAASDAFFPFRDGLDEAARAGATAVVQPGGSKNDQEVIDAANEHNMAMIFTGRRHFRH